jgi:hypothetical protein
LGPRWTPWPRPDDRPLTAGSPRAAGARTLYLFTRQAESALTWGWAVSVMYVSVLRHHDSHLRHAHRVCRIRRLAGHVMSGSAPCVARRVCDRHPHARHDQGRAWAGHRPVARRRVSPCKRFANTSGPMGDAGPRHERPDAPDRHRDVPSAPWGPRQRCRLMGRSGEFAVSDPPGIRLVRRRGAVVISTQDGEMQADCMAQVVLQPRRRTGDVRQMPSVLSLHGRDRPTSWRMICARVLARSAYSPRARDRQILRVGQRL